MQATVQAHSNIALIKYWGKRSQALKLPQNGSISLTLDKLFTQTTVAFVPELTQDKLYLNGVQASEAMRVRVQSFMDYIRTHSGTESFALIQSKNSFPTGAGLASSASAFAALALAASRAAGLNLDPEGLSRLARQGSGSACRSIYGGFVEWLPGIRDDGMDSFAQPLELNWPVWMAVLVLKQEHKATGSGEGMARTVATSPLYPAWLDSIQKDLDEMKWALGNRDFDAVGTLMEHNALKMHATALAAQPAVVYWQAQTLALMHCVYELRASGHNCYFTIDAGPNVKVLMPVGSKQTLAALKQHPAVQECILCMPGPEAKEITQESAQDD